MLSYSTPMNKMSMEDTILAMMTRFMKGFLILDIRSGYALLGMIYWRFILSLGYIPCGVGLASPLRSGACSWNDTKHAAGLHRGAHSHTL